MRIKGQDLDLIRYQKTVQLGSVTGLQTQFDLTVLGGEDLHPGQLAEEFDRRIKGQDLDGLLHRFFVQELRDRSLSNQLTPVDDRHPRGNEFHF